MATDELYSHGICLIHRIFANVSGAVIYYLRMAFAWIWSAQRCTCAVLLLTVSCHFELEFQIIRDDLETFFKNERELCSFIKSPLELILNFQQATQQCTAND